MLWSWHDARDLEDKIDRTINYSAVAEAAKSFARDQSPEQGKRELYQVMIILNAAAFGSGPVSVGPSRIVAEERKKR
jgi:hypothetical protein